MTPLHIVVVNFTRMGDLVQSSPFLRALKRNRECRLTLVVFDLFRDIAERLPMVDTVLGFDVDRLVPRLDHHHGDLSAAYTQLTEFLADSHLGHIDELYNLSHTPQSAVLCALMNPIRFYGMGRRSDGQGMVNGDWFNYLLSIMQDRTFNPFNLVEIFGRFNPHGIFSDRLELSVTESDHNHAVRLLSESSVDVSRSFVVLQPGASCASRMWPKERFAGLASRFAELGIQSVIVGSSSEKNLSENIAAQSGGSAVSLAGQTDVGTLAAVLKLAFKLVSNDTGTIHIAAAVGTPTVGIYLGPAAAKDTAPFGNGHIVIEPDLKCSPCAYKSHCNTSLCHHTISVDLVFELAMAEGQKQREIANRNMGSRIFRTEVTESGRLNLQLLNNPATGLSPEYLSFYSWFWDSLLSARRKRVGLSELWDEIPLAWREAVDRLSMIADCAVVSVNRLKNDVRNKSSEERISQSLREQLVWQNNLRDFLKRYPDVSSFPRYLLVRLSTVRTSDIEAYIEDLSKTLDHFRRGLRLLAKTTDVRKEGISTDVAIA